MRLQSPLGFGTASALGGDGLAVGKLGVGETGLQRLNAGLRLMQCPSGCAMGVALGVEGGIQFGDACLERCDRIALGATAQDDDGHTAVLHEAVPQPGLVRALLRRLMHRTLKA